MRKWDKVDIKFVIDNYKYITYEKLATQLDKTEQSVRWKIWDLGLVKRERAWSEADIQYLTANYKIMKHRKIAEILGKSERSVKDKCGYLKLCKVPRKEIHEGYFDEWSSDMAYILGFIMADGCVTKSKNRLSLDIAIHGKDLEILKFINGKLSAADIIEYNVGRSKNKVRLRATSKHMTDRLISLGVVPRKTGYETMKYIPNEWKPDFIRGYFDGDGSISTRNKNGRFGCFICGSNLELMNELLDYFKFGNIVNIAKYRKRKNNNDFYIWDVRRKCDLESFRKCIYYREDCFYLTRKHDKMFSIDTVYKQKRSYVK